MKIYNALNNEIADVIDNLGNQWQKLLKKYENRYNTTDSIHWFIERTNVGVLATSAWLCGGVAIEEYTTPNEKDREYNGHYNFYFHIDNLKAICESKMKWIEVAPETDVKKIIFGIIDTIELAKSDSKAHITPHRKMYAAFICTCWKPENEIVNNKGNVETIIESVLKNQENSASYKFKTNSDLISSEGNICNLAYLVIGDV